MSIQLRAYTEQEIYIELEEGGFCYSGDYTVADDITIYIVADDLVEQLCGNEKAELIDALLPDQIEVAVPLNEQEVDDIYAELTEAQRAHLFNKMLKNEAYNRNGTSILRLWQAQQICMTAQHKEV